MTEFANQGQHIEVVGGFNGHTFGPRGQVGQRLFHLASCKPLPDDIGVWPKALAPLIKNLYVAAEQPLPRVEFTGALPAPPTGLDPMRAVVGLSGGKDSVCVAAMLMAEGYTVHGLHIKGLNRSFPKELPMAERLAGQLGISFDVLEVRLKGRAGDDLDNRFKNQFILTQQLDFAEAIGAGTLGQGNHAGDGFHNVAFGSWFTDARENYTAFQGAFKDGFQYRTGLLANVSFVYATLMRLRPDVVPILGSCIHPHRFAGARARATTAKWGIPVMEGRCGTCYKCCWEYMILGEIAPDLVQLHEGYVGYCLDRVRAAWHLFYQPQLRPNNRLETAQAIIDQQYTPTPQVLAWAAASKK